MMKKILVLLTLFFCFNFGNPIQAFEVEDYNCDIPSTSGSLDNSTKVKIAECDGFQKILKTQLKNNPTVSEKEDLNEMIENNTKQLKTFFDDISTLFYKDSDDYKKNIDFLSDIINTNNLSISHVRSLATGTRNFLLERQTKAKEKESTIVATQNISNTNTNTTANNSTNVNNGNTDNTSASSTTNVENTVSNSEKSLEVQIPEELKEYEFNGILPSAKKCLKRINETGQCYVWDKGYEQSQAGKLGKKIEEGTIGFEDIPIFIVKMIDFLTKLVGTVALLFMIYGGFQLMTNQKDDGKTTIKYAIAGVFVAFLSWLVVNIIKTQFTGVDFYGNDVSIEEQNNN